ncbi:MAG: glycosyltransferase family 4 protein [Planctomycetota bacterium]|nr:glycosyltransferase family 4 protein [Planctomycetota bacterium]
MKIVITSPIFPPDLGGPSTYVPSLATYLTEQGHEVTVVAFCSDPDPQGWPFQVISVPRSSMLLRYWLDFYAVWKAVKGADLLYINEHLALHVAFAGRLRGIPMVIRVCVDGTWEITHRLGWHDDPITQYIHKTYGWRVRWVRKVQKLWWGWMRRIIAPSRFLESVVLGHDVAPQKIQLIHNAYHGPLELKVSKEAARETVGLPGDTKILLAICRLMIWKGVDGIIRALERLPENHHLYVAGDGDELEAWTVLAEDLGISDRVHFLGNVAHADLMTWIRASDVFVLNSSYEGLSHTLLEVMWLGLPAAVSAVCGNPELIEDRVNGRAFDFQDVDGIVDAVGEIIADSQTANDYIEKSKEKVQDFARDKIFARTEDLFFEIVGQPGPAREESS